MNHPFSRIVVVLAVLASPALTLAVSDSAPTSATASAPAASQPATTMPASQLSMVPDSVFAQLEGLFQSPAKETPAADMLQVFSQQMRQVLAIGNETEKKYPAARNLFLVQVRMLQAANFLATNTNDESARKQLVEISQRILNSQAPTRTKLQADYLLTASNIANLSQQQASQQIRSLTDRYRGTDSAALAAIYAFMLAERPGLEDLSDQLLATLKKDYSASPEVKRFLKAIGQDERVGQPFLTDLVLLDGKKLCLPQDLRGKVVLVDFWATWCQPCKAEIPRIRQAYEKFKEQGLVIVSISLDQDRQAVIDYVGKENLGWLQAFSGMGWDDPTARKYQVTAIPSLWVVGRDGTIFSSNAGMNLESTIRKALKAALPAEAAATAPAGKAKK